MLVVMWNNFPLCVLLQSSTTRLIYAFGDTDPADSSAPTEYHGTRNRGSKSIYLLEPKDTAPPKPDDALIYDVLNDNVRHSFACFI